MFDLFYLVLTAALFVISIAMIVLASFRPWRSARPR